MAAEGFASAPDFPPGSEQWRREQEKRTMALEDAVERMLKDLRTQRNTQAAANKATHIRISKLGGIEILPGMPINVQVYPYAYFDTSGYPRAGARIYWGDQNDADNYQIWMRRVNGPDTAEYADFQNVNESLIATVDVRNLECLTTYELMIRAVSPGGSYGFFTGVIEFTTPDELTQIPWLGDPIVQWHDGFASIEWEFVDSSVPAYSEYEQSSSAPSLGVDTAYWGNHASGVLAPNGNIYYPPGGWHPSGSSYDYSSSGIVLNVAAGTAVENDFGLTLDYGTPGLPGTVTGDPVGGVLGDDGIIYWVSHWSELPNSTVILTLNPATEVMTYTEVPWPIVGGFYQPLHCITMAKGGDGNIYCIPASGTDDLLVIHPGGSYSIEDMGWAYLAGESYFQAATDVNGDIWMMPSAGTNFGVIRTRSTPYFERVAIDFPGGWDSAPYGFLAGPVFNAGDESIYAFSWNLTGYKNLWCRIGPDGEQEFGEVSNSGTYISMGRTAIGADGRIWGSGSKRFPTGGSFAGTTGYNVREVGAFNPETKQFSPFMSVVSGSGILEIESAVASNDGTVVFRTTNKPAPGADLDPAKFVIVESSRTDHPATGVSEIPNYLKYMRVQRSTETGWKTIGTLAEPGVYMDPFAEMGAQYRLQSLSTAGTPGTPSATVQLEG